MTNFELLHPALRHHIVNSLGWKELRPFQDSAIPKVMSGDHAIILAPTAGGKTESAILPVLSMALEHSWEGLSMLYVCPMKALLNDLGTRLDRYFSLVGRKASVWHGDVSKGFKDRIIRESPDLLLTTPESIEAILISKRIDNSAFFGQLRVVIVDEIHLFAGDDRGWHLLALLSRLRKICGKEFQRIGLSATVGNPEDLASWLTGGCMRPIEVLDPGVQAGRDADIKIDYVGSIENAATVISRIHRGEKRLVFVDSRSRAEQLANTLRTLNVRTYVTHSSLSKEERGRAESAFQTEENCVIVATSVLEVGVDVGDLDRVIQIDAPRTVSSFLQRLGRTGRRPGARRNCLFLTTTDDSLLRALAMFRLYSKGYVEPIRPPQKPFHILAQQILALCLQESQVGSINWFDWVRDVPGFAKLRERDVEEVFSWLIQRDILAEDQGVVSIGMQGEQQYGQKNFLEILSVFVSPPIFTILHGNSEIGHLDQRIFMLDSGKEKRTLLLGGRAWEVKHLDWKRHTAHVQPTEAARGMGWLGDASGLDFDVCQAVKNCLMNPDCRESELSSRATNRLTAVKEEYPWLIDSNKTYVVGSASLEWWTFAGGLVNFALSSELQREIPQRVRSDDQKIAFPDAVSHASVMSAIDRVRCLRPIDIQPRIAPTLTKVLKFSDLLPTSLSEDILKSRIRDDSAIQAILQQSVVSVNQI